MSAPEAEGSAATGVLFVCPECGRDDFANANGLAVHRSREHDVAGRRGRPDGSKPRPTQAATSRKSGELERLRRELSKDVKALTLLPFMAKGTADRLANGAVTNLIDEKADGFADAWVAVAEQNDWVRVNLTRALSGGIWLNAAAQTAALGYVVAVFAGLIPMYPGAVMLIPEMGQFVYTAPTPAPPAGAGVNGTEPAAA